MIIMRLGIVLRLVDKKKICVENIINNNKFCLDRVRVGILWNVLFESFVVKWNINMLKCL